MNATENTEVIHSDLHKWHVLYNGTLALRGLPTQELAEAAAVEIAANGGTMPRKSRRSNRLDLRTMKAEDTTGSGCWWCMEVEAGRSRRCPTHD